MLADFTVSDMAPSVNNFANILRQPTWSIAGSSTAKARTAPNGDFSFAARQLTLDGHRSHAGLARLAPPGV